jgi:hypothetical protein
MTKIFFLPIILGNNGQPQEVDIQIFLSGIFIVI